MDASWSRRGAHRRRLATAALAALGVAACVAPAARGQRSAERDRTLVVGLLSEPATLNPLAVASTEASDIVDRLFVRLLDERGDFLDFDPRLARSWSFSADSLQIAFELRDDVRWHDGEPVTAADVRFTWQLHTDTLVAWPHAAGKAHIEDVEVIDDHTVVFHFARRYRYQLKDAVTGVILPRHLLADVPRDELAAHPFGRAPVGDGPFRMGRWASGQYLELVANPDYFEGPPVVERVLYKFVPDMVALLARLENGEIDALEAVPADKAEQLAALPSLRLYGYPSRRMVYVVWNTRHELLADPAVRNALTMAINRSELIETLWRGFATENKSPVHPILWAYDPDIVAIPFDPERARRDLRDLGWSDRDGDGVVENRAGRRFEIEMLVNNNQLRVDAVTLIRGHLARVGVDVSIRVLEFNTYVERILAGDFDAAYVNWKTQTKVDLTNDWHSGSMPPNGYNFSFYSNPQVDAWIEQARTSTRPEEERALWAKVQRAIYRDQPFTFIAIPQEIIALHRRFCGVEPNAISFFANLRHWRLAPDCEP